jgi:chromosome segregation ATPase
LSQPPKGEGQPDDNRTVEQSSSHPTLDQLLAPLDDTARKALSDHLASRDSQIKRYRTRVAELEPKASQFDEASEAAKSEAQRAAERQTRLERERDEAKAALLRYDVAATVPGLQASDAAFLTGGTREELEASAQRLLSRIQAAGQPPAPQPPAPDKAQGRDQQGGAPDAEAWLRGALHR